MGAEELKILDTYLGGSINLPGWRIDEPIFKIGNKALFIATIMPSKLKNIRDSISVSYNSCNVNVVYELKGDSIMGRIDFYPMDQSIKKVELVLVAEVDVGKKLTVEVSLAEATLKSRSVEFSMKVIPNLKEPIAIFIWPDINQINLRKLFEILQMRSYEYNIMGNVRANLVVKLKGKIKTKFEQKKEIQIKVEPLM